MLVVELLFGVGGLTLECLSCVGFACVGWLV